MMKLNDDMVFNILSALCPSWDITRSDPSLSELAKRDIYYNKEKTGCYVELASQLVNIECDFKNDLLWFDSNWDARGGGTYSLKEILPELAKKSKIKPKPKPKKHNTSNDKETEQILNQMNKYHKIGKRKPKEHKNQVDELLNRLGRY